MPIFMHLFYYVIVIVKLDWLVCMLDLDRFGSPRASVSGVWGYFLKRRHLVFCDLFFLLKFYFLVVVRFIYCYLLTKFVFLWCLGLIAVPGRGDRTDLEFLSNFFWSEGTVLTFWQPLAYILTVYLVLWLLKLSD